MLIIALPNTNIRMTSTAQVHLQLELEFGTFTNNVQRTYHKKGISIRLQLLRIADILARRHPDPLCQQSTGKNVTDWVMA